VDQSCPWRLQPGFWWSMTSTRFGAFGGSTSRRRDPRWSRQTTACDTPGRSALARRLAAGNLRDGRRLPYRDRHWSACVRRSQRDRRDSLCPVATARPKRRRLLFVCLQNPLARLALGAPHSDGAAPRTMRAGRAKRGTRPLVREARPDVEPGRVARAVASVASYSSGAGSKAIEASRGGPIPGLLFAVLLRAPRVRRAEIKRDREDQGGGPGVYGIEQQRLMAADVVGDQPYDKPDDGHLPYLPST
jgi:hypothetical protein